MRCTRSDITQRRAALFFIPSFYGAVTWGAWLMLYLMQLIRLNTPSWEAIGIFVATELTFILSALLFYPRYRSMADRIGPESVDAPVERRNSSFPLMLLLLHLMGFIGLAVWLLHVSRYLGGSQAVLVALLTAADTIRGASDLSGTIGIQISFLGWIAVALTVSAVAKKELSKAWLVLALLQLAGNFLYIARTQPIWIIFTTLLMVFVSFPNVTMKKASMWLAGAFLLFMALFWTIAEWTGKTYYEGKFDDAVIPGISQVMYAYGVSGFAYFDYMLVHNDPIAYKPERAIYPVMKLLSMFNLAEEPPSQIIEFYDVPFETNVGTFLEPFYRDGGYLYVFLSVLLHSFGLDFLGLKLLQSGRALAVYAWSNLCFTTLIGFMTPKITQFPVWLFLGVGLASMAITPLNALCRRADTPPGRVRSPVGAAMERH